MKLNITASDATNCIRLFLLILETVRSDRKCKLYTAGMRDFYEGGLFCSEVYGILQSHHFLISDIHYVLIVMVFTAI